MLQPIANELIAVTSDTTFYGDTRILSIASDTVVKVYNGSLVVEGPVGAGAEIMQYFHSSSALTCCGLFCKLSQPAFCAQQGVSVVGDCGHGVRVYSAGCVSLLNCGSSNRIIARGNFSTSAIGQGSYVDVLGRVVVDDTIMPDVTITNCTYLACINIDRNVSVTTNGGVYCTHIAERCTVRAQHNISSNYVGKFTKLTASNVSCCHLHAQAEVVSSNPVIAFVGKDSVTANPLAE